MRKTFKLNIEGKVRDRVLDAVKHDIRKYAKRERRRDLPEGMDYWDFDCRFGLSAEAAAEALLTALPALVDGAAREGADQVYVEILARPAKRTPRPEGTGGGTPIGEPDHGAGPAVETDSDAD